MLKAALKRVSFAAFDVGQLFGVYIMPKHYYVPISPTRKLRATKTAWNRPVDISYLPLCLKRQETVLNEWIAPFKSEYTNNDTYTEASRQLAGPGYGPIEAQVLHGFVRKIRPRRIIEVGSGVSTICLLRAVSDNEKDGEPPCTLTCVEPHPSAVVRGARVTLLDVPVEDVELSLFDQLQSGDLLFIDSTHSFSPLSDVTRIYVEILPRLKPGVYVHIHDIYLPYVFQRDIDRTFMQSTETALLMAILAHSNRYEILLCMSYLHYYEPRLLKEMFPQYVADENDGGLSKVSSNGSSGHFPSSIYLVVR
jgi:predicted O-methyltransferase YrrM